ncbi:secreted frizzled-related protein 1b isoform X1 [Ictalurus punctatus]|uniref:Secreted frizzled-related protein 1 n=1 Tax=Ictalurus punctatus TaxID=7998 RepID=W5UCR8_ICTPU|nr:secreted frizzled-related protein 1b isoform X1 [Ictalurus punctatus]
MHAPLARAMTEMFLLASLALLSRVPSIGSFSDGEYIWSSGSSGQGNCVEIPEDLRLCYGVGYRHMLLPNLLEHDSMAEVKQQASSWVPLVHRRCHPGTQVFLCSLFSPVCTDPLVRPCQLFCESVRDACSPIMKAFGFVWPEMLNCSRFPLENDMCISKNATASLEESEHMPACPPCEVKMNADGILENMCASEFAITAKIKKTKIKNADKMVILQKKKKVVWDGGLKNEQLKKLVLYLKNGTHCPCQQLDNTSDQYLIMGRRVGKHYLLTGIHQWDKENGEFRKLLTQIKTYKCPALDSTFKITKPTKSDEHDNPPGVLTP